MAVEIICGGQETSLFGTQKAIVYGAFVWGVDFSIISFEAAGKGQWSPHRVHGKRTMSKHSIVIGKLGELVSGFASLMVHYPPMWLLEVNVDALKNLRNALRPWKEEKLSAGFTRYK